MDGAHRWAYRAWIGPIPEGQQINHHCDVPACFRPEHLYVGSQSQNIKDAVRRGRHVKNRGGAKLTAEQRAYIRESKETAVALAKKFGVHRLTVADVRHGTTWVGEFTSKEAI